MANDKFDFGQNEQPSLFDIRGSSTSGSAPEDLSGEGGSFPTLPLQFCNCGHLSTEHDQGACTKCSCLWSSTIFQPKELRLEPIEHNVARNIWLREHYLHRDYAGATLEFGVFPPNHRELIGAIGFSSRLGGSVKGGKPNTWEIRRMWLSDIHCARNSESRVLAISCRMVKKLAPHVLYIISYSDHTLQGHKGTIYKAAGFKFSGETGERDWTTNKSHKTVDGHSKKRWILWLK